MAAGSPTTTTVTPHMQLPRVHPTGVHTLPLQRHFMSNGFSCIGAPLLSHDVLEQAELNCLCSQNRAVPRGQVLVHNVGILDKGIAHIEPKRPTKTHSVLRLPNHGGHRILGIGGGSTQKQRMVWASFPISINWCQPVPSFRLIWGGGGGGGRKPCHPSRRATM